MSIASIAAIRSAPITPIAPVSLGKAERPRPVHAGDGEAAGMPAPVRAAPPAGMGVIVDKTA